MVGFASAYVLTDLTWQRSVQYGLSAVATFTSAVDGERMTITVRNEELFLKLQLGDNYTLTFQRDE